MRELDKHEQRDADIRKMTAMRDEMQRKIASTHPGEIIEQRAVKDTPDGR